MTKLTNILLTSALVLGTSIPATAGTPVINAREHRQQHRIAQGIASGELTVKEVIRLEARQARVRVMEAHAKSDGVVTFGERVRLNRELNRASRKIHKQKTD